MKASPKRSRKSNSGGKKKKKKVSNDPTEFPCRLTVSEKETVVSLIPLQQKRILKLDMC